MWYDNIINMIFRRIIMKKKIILAVAIMLVAVMATAVLSACSPSQPDKFFEAYIKSIHKGQISLDGNLETGIDGNKYIIKTNDKNQTIFEKVKDDEAGKDANGKDIFKYNVYTCIAGKWTAATLDAKKFEDTYTNPFKNDSQEINDEKIQEEIRAMFHMEKGDTFGKKWQKKDGKWVLKDSSADISIQTKGNNMTVTVGKAETVYMLYYKIEIPAEATAALK